MTNSRGHLGSASTSRLRTAGRLVLNFIRQMSCLRSRYPPPLGSRPPLQVAVCAIFRDEAPYLAEWVTFHRIQGVERFFLYDNLSSDDWRSALAPEIAAGVVEVSQWSEVPGQPSAYADCLARHRRDVRWMAFIDVDEFLFSPTGRPLPDVLRGFDRFPGVVANWRIYGTNGWETAPDGLVIENYPLRAPDDHPANTLVKSIVYPLRTLGLTEAPAHYFRLRGNPYGEDHRPALQIHREPPTADLLRINHYYAKSKDQFRRKAARPRADFGVVTERFPDPPGEVHDSAILQFVPAVKNALATRTAHELEHVGP